MTHPINDLSSLSPSQRALLERRLRQRRGETRSTTIPPRPDGASFPLSFAQQRLWFIDQLDPGNAAYNISGAVRLTGRSGSTHSRAPRRNCRAPRRAAIQYRGGRWTAGPAHLSARPFDLPILEVPGADDASRLAAARGGFASSAASRLFDLSADGPLLRATLLRLDAADHVLVLSMHHVASDGWSTGVVLRELTALYRSTAATGFRRSRR